MIQIRHLMTFLIGTGVLVTSFNNCGPSFSPQDSLSSKSMVNGAAICEAQLREVYKATYYPFLSTQCLACHSTAQGSRDLQTSYQAFVSRGEELIDYQATHAHGGNNFSSAQQIEIDKFKPTWDKGQLDYQACLSSMDTDRGLDEVLTLAKAIPTIEPTADTNNWVKVQWDLETEVESWALGKFAAVFQIEAKLNKVNGEVAGLLVRNPTLRLKRAPNLSVSGLMIHIDNREQTAVTTYATLTKIVSGTTEVKLVDSSASAYAAYPGFTKETRLAFQFKALAETNQTPPVAGTPVAGTPVPVDIPDVPIPAGGVTFSQLTSGSSPYRVFNRSCTGCHNSGSGRLDLTNHTTASAASEKIIERMNSTTNPMPPTGLLRQNDRDIVNSWVKAGTPK